MTKLQGLIPSDLFRRFKSLAAMLGVTMQSAVEEAATDWVEKKEGETNA